MVTYAGLILDFGGVVTTDFFGALDAFSERAGLGEGAFLRAFRDHPEGRQALKAVEKGELPQREFERIIGAILGVDDNGLLRSALADLEPRPEVIDLIRRARAEGIRLAALSNSLGSGDYDSYADWDLEEMFDVVVISHQVGLRKPHPKIFTLTAEQLGLPPSACLFVDDTAHNLTGAASLGMGTLHFTGAETEIAGIDRLLGLA